MIQRALLTACSLTLSGAAAFAAPEIRWLPGHSAVEVIGIETAPLKQAKWSPDKWAALLLVQMEGADETLPPMLGTWSVENSALRFTPRFPLTAGMRYRATYQPPSGQPVTSQHEVPKPATVPSTVVTHIFPGGDTLPENLLKFYLHFSAPMNSGGIYKHIHLRDAKGKDVELPFLEIDEELWDREMKRLTLFIDPGRIKREVKPLQDIGPALVAGRNFSLVIDAAWQDAAGLPLKRSAEKKFTVSAPDREPPDPARWKLTNPAANSRDALRLTFPEPMEHALSLRLITVRGMAGKTALNDDGHQWSFTPDNSWTPGAHRLIIQPELEDLAGNSIGKPFEVDIAGTDKERPAAKAVVLEFEVR